MASMRKVPIPSHQKNEDEYWETKTFRRFDFAADDDELEDSIEQNQTGGVTSTALNLKNTQVNYGNGEKSYAAQQQYSATPPRATSARSHRPTMPKKQNLTPSSVTPLNNDVTKSKSATDTRSISEVVHSQSMSAPSATELAKLETERNSLRRQLNQAKRERAAAPSKTDTLRHIMVGTPYVLELYKSKEDKASLLDLAIQRFDGNAIVAATLFMRDTLKRDLFSKELMSRPVAVDHYCSYLREAGEIDELHETLSALGRTEEAAMLKYKQCLQATTTTTPEIRSSGLKDCIKYYFDVDLSLAAETSAIFEQIAMTERQSVVEDADCKAEKSGNIQIFKTHPRKGSIIHKSVVETLFYCSYYHWGEADGLLSSPISIRNQHQVGEKQFIFTALSALCRMRRWRDIEELLTAPRSFLRSARLQTPIGFDRVVDVLSKNLAPPDAIEKYCAEIETSDRRLEMAVKLKCHKVAIDTFVHQRNRQQMMLYLDQIPTSNQHMRQYLLNQSQNQAIKWKN